ncbi:hypothetical protein TNCV_2337101 [Trichonephila clavipes]|nr:hypothetical protein TNCV_2337101 [Trichonephila clavipes]
MMLQHQGEDSTGKPDTSLIRSTNPTAMYSRDTEERYHQPIDRSGLTPASLRSNSWDAQLAVPNDLRYARLETNMGIGQTKEG